MSGEQAELRASVPGCDVVARIDPERLRPRLRAALIEVAEAMHAESTSPSEYEDEVSGYALAVGSLGLESGTITASKDESCWFYDSGHCGWYSGPLEKDGGASSCRIHTWK